MKSSRLLWLVFLLFAASFVDCTCTNDDGRQWYFSEYDNGADNTVETRDTSDDAAFGSEKPEVPKANRIASGAGHTCVILSTAEVKCWGANDYGQIGNGTTEPQLTAVLVEGIDDAVQLSANWHTTCALRRNGAVSCWGRRGKLEEFDTAPVDVPVPAGVTRISVGEHHFCTLLTTKTVHCGPDQEEVTWLSDVTDFVSGTDMKCASQTNGEVICMDSFSFLTPHQIEGIEQALALSARRAHACALEASGRVGCWGYNPTWQPGDGSDEFVRDEAIFVVGLDDAVEVAAGSIHTCAVRENGRVSCWGGNLTGQLGDGTFDDRPHPREVAGLENVVGITAAAGHSCALLDSGQVRCWGNNATGQLGDGTTTDRLTPVDVVGIR